MTQKFMNQAGKNISLGEIDKQSVMHSFTSIAQLNDKGPLIIERGDGINLTDEDGKVYLDAVASLWCVNLGWKNKEINDAISKQLDDLAFYHNFTAISNPPMAILADKILKVAPPNMRRVFFGNSGSDANDTNVKLIWYYNNLLGRPQKKKIIAREDAYHGVTVAAASLTGLSSVHKHFDLPLPQIVRVEKPHYHWNMRAGQTEREYSEMLAADLETKILAEGPDTIAAFYAEPVMGAGGVVPPPDGYFELVQKVLDKYDILMIADEVITGFGRTGYYFASEKYGIRPDIISVAKGLTNGYIPMGASIIGERIWSVLEEKSGEFGPFIHGYTYSGHPVAAAAGVAVMEIMERDNTVAYAAEVGDYFQRRLREEYAGHPLVGEVRGVGLMAAIELAADPVKKIRFDSSLGIGPRLAGLCRERGMIVRALFQSTAIGFSPALIITRDEIEDILSRFTASLNDLQRQLENEGIWSDPN